MARFYTARHMAEIHRSRARRPKQPPTPTVQRATFDSQRSARGRSWGDNDNRAFAKRLARRRARKGYKVTRKGGRLR